MRHWNDGFGPGSQHMMNYGSYGFIWAIIIGIVLLVIFFLIYKLFQQNKQTTKDVRSDNQALSILQERYAKGELTDDEFARMKKVLEKDK